jgi:hypothetical protein
MTSLDSIQGIAEQPGQQQQQMPLQPGQSPSQTNVPGLPPTALSMQSASLNEQYQQQQQQAQAGGMQAMGAGLQTGGGLMLEGHKPAPTGEDRGYGVSSLQDMAEKLARGYGLEFGRGSLVDAEGNFMQTPEQLAASQAGGGDMAGVAANMNYIAQAINDRQVQMQQDKATAALQAGMGQVQSRGRGSLAAMQSGFYQAMAANYTDPNLLPEQADFSFWIQKAGFDEAASKLGDEAAGTKMQTKPTTGDEQKSTTTSPTGKGDPVTTGPHAGQRPVYTYDPVSKTTTVSWEDV